MMNHMENESDQEFIHYEGQQPPLFWGLKIFILVRKPGLPYGSVSLLKVSDDDGLYPLKHVRLTCAQ